jgi:hypothetical protein
MIDPFILCTFSVVMLSFQKLSFRLHLSLLQSDPLKAKTPSLYTPMHRVQTKPHVWPALLLQLSSYNPLSHENESRSSIVFRSFELISVTSQLQTHGRLTLSPLTGLLSNRSLPVFQADRQRLRRRFGASGTCPDSLPSGFEHLLGLTVRRCFLSFYSASLPKT